MNAAYFRTHGDPDVLEYGELPAPVPGPGEVRIAVAASSLNHLDLWVRRGLPGSLPLPHVGGADIAGVVESVGEGVDGIPPGVRVVVDPSLDYSWYESSSRGPDLPNPRFRLLGEHVWGGFAALAVVPSANLLQLPDGVSFEEAAAMALVGVTAWRGLMGRGELRSGERVLITGGSGGVATVALQMARNAGAEVYAVTSGPENQERLRALGAHVVVDRREGELGSLLKQAMGGARMDLVLDSVGEAFLPALIRCLAPGGRLVSYGATTGAVGTIDLRHLFWKQLSFLGTTMGTTAEFRAAMGQLFSGRVRPVIQEVLPLAECRRAHRLLEEGRVFGKLVLVP